MNALIPVTVGNKVVKIKLTFHDSLTLLPLSLDNLIKALDIPAPKLHFPYTFVNENNLKYAVQSQT